MVPYLDLAGFKRRSPMAAGDVDFVETDSPGYIATRIAVRSSYINGRMRKRYGAGDSTSLPFGQTPPPLIAAGTNPPGVTLTGRPTLGSLQVGITITTPGGLGVGVFKYTLDGGVTYTANVTLAATVVLGSSGLTANFVSATYGADNVYTAATPVPEIVLGWLTTFVTYDAFRKRGMNPSDPAAEMLVKDVENAMAEIKEAADSKDGLFDLPVSEDLDSAVTTGGPLGFSDSSPYAWQARQAAAGAAQDQQDFITMGVDPLDFSN